MEATQNLQKDLIYISIAFILFVIIPITAGIAQSKTWEYFLIPAIISIYIINFMLKTWTKIKNEE